MVNERVSLDLGQGLLNTQKKVLAKTVPFAFVEIELPTNIKFSFFPECKIVIHSLRQYSSFDVWPGGAYILIDFERSQASIQLRPLGRCEFNFCVFRNYAVPQRFGENNSFGYCK